MSKLIAFDQALNTTGYVIFDGNSVVETEKFTTSDSSTAEKLMEIRNHVISLLDESKPDEVVIEEIQLQQIPGSTAHGNVETFKKLAYVQAIFLEILAERNIKYSIVPSSVWKSTCGVKGRARAEQKRNAQAFVLAVYGIKAIQDICDAVCIGHHILEEKNKIVNWE